MWGYLNKLYVFATYGTFINYRGKKLVKIITSNIWPEILFLRKIRVLPDWQKLFYQTVKPRSLMTGAHLNIKIKSKLKKITNILTTLGVSIVRVFYFSSEKRNVEIPKTVTASLSPPTTVLREEVMRLSTHAATVVPTDGLDRTGCYLQHYDETRQKHVAIIT